MDNREVLVKLQYNTKYGVQLQSSRVLRNYNLYKYLVLKHIPEQVYIDYSNEDCEMVNLKELLDNATVCNDKTQIESFNNLKQLLSQNTNIQYDLFTLIDNAYNDVLGHKVESDLSFDKYTYFFKQFVELSKSLMCKYVQFVGTDDFPKDMNQLYQKELGNDRYNQLLEWIQEPVVNDININLVLNFIIHNSGLNIPPIVNPVLPTVPLHKEAMSRCDFVNDKSELFKVKEKVIITKNQSGFYTFKDLIFNLQTSLVIGKWNANTMSMDKLSSDDIELCKYYNLKHDETRVQLPVIETASVLDTVTLSENNVSTNDIKTILNVQEKTEKNEPEIINTVCSILEHTSVDEINEVNDVELNKNNVELNITEEVQQPQQENINPYSSVVIPIANDKVSRGRKKTNVPVNNLQITTATSTVTNLTNLKTKAQVARKTAK